MRLAVRKVEGHIPGGGFHYMLHPMPMENDFQATAFRQMGHILIEVPDTKGDMLIAEACAAIKHQVEIAILAEKAGPFSPNLSSTLHLPKK